MRKLATLLTIAATLALVGSATAAITIDGVLNAGEWDGYTFADPANEAGASSDIVSWGAKSEGDYLYWYVQLDADQTYIDDFMGDAGGIWKIYPALWIDADCSTSTYLADGGTPNCADAKGGEWATNHRGIDMNLELDLETNPWTPGDLSTYWYWGLNDDIDQENSAVNPASGAAWMVSGSVMEARVLLSEIEAKIEAGTDGVSADNYVWYAAVGCQGTNRGQGDPPAAYGYDLTTPTAIGIDGDWLGGDFNMDGSVTAGDLAILADNYGATSGAYLRIGDANYDGAVTAGDLAILADNYGSSFAAPAAVTPEPATLGLLALGVLGLLRRR